MDDDYLVIQVNPSIFSDLEETKNGVSRSGRNQVRALGWSLCGSLGTLVIEDDLVKREDVDLEAISELMEVELYAADNGNSVLASPCGATTATIGSTGGDSINVGEFEKALGSKSPG